MEKFASPPRPPSSTARFLAPVEPIDLKMLAGLPGLALRARYLVEGMMNSDHRSPRRGSGIEFTEYRAYQRGDDLRRVDWRLYGRADRLCIKQFEEGVQMRMVVALDVSASMRYRSPRAALSKFDYARATLGAMALLAQRQQDAVGAAFLAEDLLDYIPPRSSPSHLRNVMSLLDTPRVGSETRLAETLSALAEALPSRSLLVIASDFYEDIEPLSQVIRRLRYEHHDVIGLHILDPLEVDFDFPENGIFVDLENSAEIAVEPQALRKLYHQRFHAFQEDLAGVFTDFGLDLFTLRTDESPVPALSSYLAHRATRT